MLVLSDRITAPDMAHWRKFESLDAAWVKTSTFRRDIFQARQSLQSFLGKGPAYVGVSWGKDSVVVAHLCHTLDPSIPMVWVKVNPIGNPDCDAVCEALVARTGAIVHTMEVDCWRDEHGHLRARGTLERGFAMAVDRFGPRYISGIRSEESATRKLRLAKHGVSTALTCAPLSRWCAQSVFAYLHHHGLPVHPAYACSFGGMLDRNRIRVAAIGGDRGNGTGREEWERAYYPDQYHLYNEGKVNSR